MSESVETVCRELMDHLDAAGQCAARLEQASLGQDADCQAFERLFLGGKGSLREVLRETGRRLSQAADEQIRMSRLMADYAEASRLHSLLCSRSARLLALLERAGAEDLDTIPTTGTAADLSAYHTLVERLSTAAVQPEAFRQAFALNMAAWTGPAAPEGKPAGGQPAAGQYVTFGHYPQTAGGQDRTPIQWLVLARENRRVLLISRDGLDVQPYNEAFKEVTWEVCSLRRWLNTTFLQRAFSAGEQRSILTCKVDNRENAWNTSGGPDTQDKVFLLSCAEANLYFGVTRGNSNNRRARVAPSAYALRLRAQTGGSRTTAEGAPAGWWWLRSPGFIRINAAYVESEGFLNYCSVSRSQGCVRPAIWVNRDIISV